MQYPDLEEQRTHGTARFPFAFYHVQEGHPRYEMPFHWHKEWELISVLQGSFTCYIDGNPFSASPGDYLLIPSGAIHGGTPSGCVYECAVFDPQALLMHPEACRRYLQKIALSVPDIALFSSDSPKFWQIASHLFSCVRSMPDGWELLLTGALFELFGVLWQDGHFSDSSAPVSDLNRAHLLKPVLEYVDTHYMQPVTLPELAQLTGMTPRYFCRFFYSYIHRTPIDYLNYYRIEQACRLLSSSNLSVTETAYQCGFNDSSYFVKIFRKYKGVTPLQYRKNGLPVPE